MGGYIGRSRFITKSGTSFRIKSCKLLILMFSSEPLVVQKVELYGLIMEARVIDWF